LLSLGGLIQAWREERLKAFPKHNKSKTIPNADIHNEIVKEASRYPRLKESPSHHRSETIPIADIHNEIVRWRGHS
jgi:hypothetical protein